MRRMTVSEYIKSGGMLVDEQLLIDKVPQCIIDNVETLKLILNVYYGGFCLSRDPEDVPIICNGVYISNNYRYATLFNTMGLSYNPIENYRMEEIGEDANSGVDMSTRDIGDYTDSTIVQPKTTTTNVGAYTTSNRHDVSPYNSNNFVPESQDSGNIGAHTDTVSEGKTDVDMIHGNRHDVDKIEHGKKVSHKLMRSGNIGVTTSQQMIQSERDVAEFSFFNIVARDVVNQICWGVM